MYTKLLFCFFTAGTVLFAETLVKFDFNNGLNHDVVDGADPQSFWALPTNEKVGFLSDWDGNDQYTLSNNGIKPTYYGGSYGNAHRAEWGLSYNTSNSENDTSVGGSKKGNIKDGFSINSGRFSILLNITDWNMFSEENDSSVVFKARTADNLTVVGFKITGDVSSGNTTIQGIAYNPSSIHGKPLSKFSKIIKADSLSGTKRDITGPIGITIDYDNQTYTVFANGSSVALDAINEFDKVTIEKVRLSTENFALPNFITFDDVSFIKN
jgi:hypothetical protein